MRVVVQSMFGGKDRHRQRFYRVKFCSCACCINVGNVSEKGGKRKRNIIGVQMLYLCVRCAVLRVHQDGEVAGQNTRGQGQGHIVLSSVLEGMFKSLFEGKTC